MEVELDKQFDKQFETLGFTEYITTDEEMENENLEKKRLLYADKNKVMLGILRIMKKLNIPLEKLQHEKTIDEINQEIYKTKISINIDELTRSSLKNMYNSEVKKNIIRKKYDMIPPLLDFMFNLFITYYLPEYPAYGLTNLNAFYFVCGIIKARGCVSNSSEHSKPQIGVSNDNELFYKTGRLFELFLKDEKFKDVCVENPPYYILNFTEDNMLEKNLNELFIPKLNELFDCIIEMIPIQTLTPTQNSKMEITDDEDENTKDNMYMVD